MPLDNIDTEFGDFLVVQGRRRQLGVILKTASVVRDARIESLQNRILEKRAVGAAGSKILKSIARSGLGTRSLVGAGVGAGTGLITGEDSGSALKGALMGGALGAAAGPAALRMMPGKQRAGLLAAMARKERMAVGQAQRAAGGKQKVVSKQLELPFGKGGVKAPAAPKARRAAAPKAPVVVPVVAAKSSTARPLISPVLQKAVARNRKLAGLQSPVAKAPVVASMGFDPASLAHWKTQVLKNASLSPLFGRGFVEGLKKPLG